MKTILLADDEEHLRTLVRTTLEDPGYRIIEASDGPSAVALTLAEHPDLLLLDWTMPGMSGIDVVRELRRQPATADLPVVMLTANADQNSRMEALGLAVEAYLVKPFSPLELLERVRGILADLGTPIDPNPSGNPVLTEEVRQHLEHSDSQLALYARDLKRALDSERKSSDELAQACKRLESLSVLKSEFLSFVCHELRTPLNALSILECADPLSDVSERREVAEIARSGYTRLRSFIERGLEYLSWLGADPIRETSRVDLVELVRRVSDGMPALHAPGVRFELLAITRPCLVDADAAHLEDVVRILLENAVKFSADKPRIRVELLSAEGRVLVKVSDAGVGLPPERIASLFEPYSIVDVVHHSSGSGLHLAIAQLIVLAHGGDIRVESPGPGKGSTFTVSLPSAHSTHRAYSRTEAAGGDPT